jgi:hypothetical protein
MVKLPLAEEPGREMLPASTGKGPTKLGSSAEIGLLAV